MDCPDSQARLLFLFLLLCSLLFALPPLANYSLNRRDAPGFIPFDVLLIFSLKSALCLGRERRKFTQFC
jgi:hypothetical protein